MITDPLVMIANERERQQSVEGWTPQHDDRYNDHELAIAAACYAIARKTVSNTVPFWWPWHSDWWEPTPNDRIRELVKAGALIVAEIERLQRLESQ